VKFFSNKNKIEKSKSNHSIANAFLAMDSQGNIIDTVFYTNENEIRSNASVSTIISKQSSIINEGRLVIKEEKDGYSEVVTNNPANQFLNWLYKPNSRPAPNNIVHIINHLMSEYYRSGVSGVVFTFNRADFSMKGKKNIKLAKDIGVVKRYNQVRYTVSLDDEFVHDFVFNYKYLNFAKETDTEIMILFVIGNYDIKNSEYKSVFNDQFDYVLLQNYLIKFATSFHKNACFPSQLIKIGYKGASVENSISDVDMKKFKAAIDEFKLQVQQNKGAKNAGGIIIPSHPSLEIDVIPLSIPTNASDNIIYHNLVSKKIFSFVDGGSQSAYEGENEYSNNASSKLLEIYDGTFRIFNSVVLTPLNIFMEDLFIAMKIKIGDVSIGISTSNIKIYQKQDISTIVMLSQNNLIKINEGRKTLASSSELVSYLSDTPDGDVFNSQLVKNAKETAK